MNLKHLASYGFGIIFNLSFLSNIAIADTRGVAASIKTIETTMGATCRKAAWFTTEARILRIWAKIADGNFDSDNLKIYKQLYEAGVPEPYEITTPDGVIIRGLVVGQRETRARTALVIASGNVGNAEIMMTIYSDLAKKLPYDLYFVDYRGYKLSRPASPSFRAFVDDTVLVAKDLRSRGEYDRVLAYGPSFGGVILMNAMARGANFDHLIIDSVPSSLSAYDCPSEVEPISLLPSICPRISAITATNDSEVPHEQQHALLSRISDPDCSGAVLELSIAGHATNDRLGSPEHVERIEALAKVLGELPDGAE